MKVFNILSHPMTVISLFLFILITGESIGGVYLFYLILALSDWLIHGILALIAVSLFLIAHLPLKNNAVARSILDSAAVLCLLLSLYFFFHNDSEGYNSGSFSTGAFWITFSLFALAAMALLAGNIWSLRHPDD